MPPTTPKAPSSIQGLRVICPYCKVGGCDIAVIHKLGADQVEGINDPRACDACGLYFKVQIRMNLVGVPLPSPGKPHSQGAILQKITGG